jgi:hypothetical protein
MVLSSMSLTTDQAPIARLTMNHALTPSIPWSQYAAYFVMAALLTVLTSNDVVILTLTPVIYHFSKATGIDPAPLLFLEFFTANVWSMALLIGVRRADLPARASCLGLALGESGL